MREIKFRTHDKRSGAIEYVDLKDLADGATFDIKYQDYDWMEFTGLTDRYGKEIYEGDILAPGLRMVSWQQGEYGMGDGWYTESQELKTGFWTLSNTQTENSEVIGNIYENPELVAGYQKTSRAA